MIKINQVARSFILKCKSQRHVFQLAYLSHCRSSSSWTSLGGGPVAGAPHSGSFGSKTTWSQSCRQQLCNKGASRPQPRSRKPCWSSLQPPQWQCWLSCSGGRATSRTQRRTEHVRFLQSSWAPLSRKTGACASTPTGSMKCCRTLGRLCTMTSPSVARTEWLSYPAGGTRFHIFDISRCGI